MGRLVKPEATKISLIRDMQEGEGGMKSDEEEKLEVEIVGGEVKKSLMGNEEKMQELELKQPENQAYEDILDIKAKERANTTHNGEYRKGVDEKSDEERENMMGSGTETPPSTIAYLPLRSEIYPPVLNVKQDFR